MCSHLYPEWDTNPNCHGEDSESASLTHGADDETFGLALARLRRAAGEPKLRWTLLRRLNIDTRGPGYDRERLPLWRNW
jgi:hypothetical protein